MEKELASEKEDRTVIEKAKKTLEEKLLFLQKAQEKYRQLLHQFSFVVHPFNYENNQAQFSSEVLAQLGEILSQLTQIARSVGLNPKKLTTVRNQLDDIAQLMDLWWD